MTTRLIRTCRIQLLTPNCWPAAQVALKRHADVLRDLGALFADAGHELYLVGGSVRDALLGRLGTDLDFTTDARPEQVQQILRPWADALWDTGIEFGTVGVGKGDQRMEITTFRADTYDQVSRNPQVRFGDRLDDDLVRRDFTVNAMAVRITADGPGEFLDPLGGLGALRARRARHPCGARGVVRRRSAADAAGGAVRLAARLRRSRRGCARRCAAMAPQLGRITAERVAAELDKLMLGADPVAGHRPDGARPASAMWCCPRSARCGWPSTNTISTRTSTSIR